jgi:hypothetical protein
MPNKWREGEKIQAGKGRGGTCLHLLTIQNVDIVNDTNRVFVFLLVENIHKKMMGISPFRREIPYILIPGIVGNKALSSTREYILQSVKNLLHR